MKWGYYVVVTTFSIIILVKTTAEVKKALFSTLPSHNNLSYFYNFCESFSTSKSILHRHSVIYPHGLMNFERDLH